MSRFNVNLLLVGFLFAGHLSHAMAEEPIDFNRDIRPLLSSNCVICHGPDEEERAANLRLDTEDGSREDLGGYAAVVPGNADESELIARITTDDEDIAMPPEGKGRRFTPDEVDMIRRWIKQGAHYAKHWSYEKPIRPALPQVNDDAWLKNPIDHFVLSRLESKQLKPSQEADRLTLARRVALDLTGLPPTWEEAKAFAEDSSDDAYEHFVDRLLTKTAFGERWARVWLDLARYADSAGYADDPPRTIWAYRDYVIRALNENMPFDQFTIEQIAGDLLPNPTTDQLVATAFHRNTLTNNEGGTNDEEFRNVAVVDRVNTTMAVWMGTTMACAQCHTHKYDPITQHEYFQFFAFFNNTEDSDKKDERPTIPIWTDSQESEKLSLRERIEELKAELEAPNPKLEKAMERWLASEREEPQWRSLVPKTIESKFRDFEIDDDGWVTVTRQKPNRDNYVVQIPVASTSMTGLKLEVPADQQSNFVLSQVKATWRPVEERGAKARFVRVELPGKKRMIHLAELQVFSDGKNVALEGTASQSSTDYGGDVKRVNDGNTDGDYQKNSGTHTKVSDNPWLEIDLGSVMPIDRVVIWNRTDGSTPIIERLKGFQVSLLDAERNAVWKESPAKVPNPSQTYSPDGAIQISFSTALADFEQRGFTASSVISTKLDRKKGWAIAPHVGKPHELTLIADRPIALGDGTLEIQLNQGSEHLKHVLDRFRLSMTEAPNVMQWAKMPAAVRRIVRNESEKFASNERKQLLAYYRTISPLLHPQRTELEKMEKKLAGMTPATTVPVLRQLAEGKRRVTNVQIRGNYLSKGDEVDEGTPAVFHSLKNAKRDRLALARWLVDDENPLTARVIANRHWEQIFGVGIVETSEEFGSQGELPTHPQLLDWLAVELRESGWDVKHLLKLLVMSATYRQSSTTTDDARTADPFNRLLTRGPRFRVSAEMVRDQALFTSGLLVDKLFGPPVKPPQPELGLKAAFGSQTDWTASTGDDRYRRGLYTSWRRSSPYPSMAQFDAPNREVCTVRRIRTNTPLQALVTLNDPVYVEAAQSLARKMIAASDSPLGRVEHGFHRCLIRDPSDAEVERLIQLVEDTKDEFAEIPEEARKMATDPLGALPEGADVAEYAAWTVVGNVLLNLDEIFMKR